MTIALRYAARSDVGLVRSNNQDSAYAGPDLLVVADGMGGHAGGDVASSVAVGELAGLDGESHGSDDALDHLEHRISSAHEALLRRVGEDPGLAGMGTTVTALLRSGDRLALAHIGDSRGYLMRAGELTQVTRDHTFVQGLVDQGRISPEEAEHHPQRSVIMRVLGDNDSSTDPDSSWREALIGDRWLLCSDGLSGVVSHDTLTDAVREVRDVGECADALVALALRSGAPDNVTVVVADVVQLVSAPPSSPQVVGAAARARTRQSSATSSPAARAAALGRETDDAPDEDDGDGDDDPDGGPPRAWRALGALLVVVVLGAGAAGAWAWGRQQFFVGADGGAVAIYRGLQQDLGPVGLSSVFEAQELRTDELPDYWREQVEDRISADDLAEARQVVTQLRQRSAECRQAGTVPDEPPSPAPSPTGGAADGPAPEFTAVPPTPTPAPALPAGCEGVGR